VVFNSGDPGDAFYVVVEGKIVIGYPDGHGTEITLAVLGPGQFFGEIALIDGGARTATARAQDQVSLLSLTRDQFHDFVRHHPMTAIHMMGVVGQRQRETVEKLRGIRNVNEAVEEMRTRVQRIAEAVAAFASSEIFVVVNLFFFALWMAINTVNHVGSIKFHDDPPTFSILEFFISLEAIMLSIFVLYSQRRQKERETIKADLDYQVSRLAHLEIMQLHEKIDRLRADVRQLTDPAQNQTKPNEGHVHGPDNLVE
jgi:uncharacterized membrane protein